MLYGLQDIIDFDRLVIFGGFNYSLLRPQTLSSSTSSEWLMILGVYFNNAMQMNDLTEIPTFQISHNDSIISSVIDYIYLGHQFYHQLQDTDINRIESSWSDHSMLDIKLIVGQSPTGPGLWRANPVYATHTALQQQIIAKEVNLLSFFTKNKSSLTPAEKWDRVKTSQKR
jgi:hypothetical protein